MRAVVFGTGRIAGGLLAELFVDAGWDVTLIGTTRSVVDRIERDRAIRLRLVDGRSMTERDLQGVRAVGTYQRVRVLEEIATADLIATAVGVGNLPAVASLLAEGLARRDRPVDVVACENHDDPGALLQRLVAADQPYGDVALEHGFAGGLVVRAVTQRIVADGAPVTYVGEPIRELVVEGQALRVAVPDVRGVVPVAEFEAYVRRKLFVFSAGHATAAYLGQVKGYRYVHAAVSDPEIAHAVLAAMREGQLGIAARYGNSFAAFVGPPCEASAGPGAAMSDGSGPALRQILARFANAALCDPVSRVGRDPRRKLQTTDRLLGAALLAAEGGVEPTSLLMAAAAALCFEGVDDPGASALHDALSRVGVVDTLQLECGVDDRPALTSAVFEAWRRLTGGCREVGNTLLSIDRPQWAWEH